MAALLATLRAAHAGCTSQ